MDSRVISFLRAHGEPAVEGTPTNREMIANHIIEQMKCHDGHFPDRDTFIAKVGE